ncbi:hypothetical protein [Massilia eurypsychrophila]|nr:hypothetical protein [Massilia eurypsychrophila]
MLLNVTASAHGDKYKNKKGDKPKRVTPRSMVRLKSTRPTVAGNGVWRSQKTMKRGLCSFKLDVVTVGRDIDGEDITSCVAGPETTMGAVKRTKLPTGGNQKIAFDTLNELLSKSVEFNNGGEPGQAPCIRMDEAIGLIAARLTCEPKRRTERAQQALATLVAKEVIVLKGEYLARA